MTDGLPDIRKALELHLDGMTPSLATAWENTKFQPVVGVPYQRVNLLPGIPENPTIGGTFKRELGLFQVTLMYPQGTGTKDAGDRAQLIRDRFPRGTELNHGNVYVMVDKTPEIRPGSQDGDRWSVPVRIQYYANIS
jgi:hypothetical protein